MAYFDSSKNRALWEIRLKELRAERAAREAGEERSTAFKEHQPTASPSRVRVSYKELLAEEAKDGMNRKRGPASMERGRSREKENVQERQREAGL